MASFSTGNWKNDTFRKVEIVNGDKSLIQKISDEQYADFLQTIFEKSEHRQKVLKLDECCNPSCTEKGTKKCGKCKQMHYCSKPCQAAHWKSHKKKCRAASADRLPRMTIYFERYSSENCRMITNHLLNDTAMKFASNIINEFAFPNASICAPSFIKQYGKYLNVNDLKTFTTDNTALVVISATDLHWFRVPRHKEGLDEITPIMYQKYVYGDEFDEFVFFIFDLMFSSFPDVMDDGSDGKGSSTQEFNDYMQQYCPRDGAYMQHGYF